MLFLIINLEKKTFLYQPHHLDEPAQTFINLYKKQNDYFEKSNRYAIGAYEKSNILFIYFYIKYNLTEKLNITYLDKWAEKLGKIFSEEEIIMMKNDDRSFLSKKIKEEFLTYDTEIWLHGPLNSGKSSICYMSAGFRPDALFGTSTAYKISKMDLIDRTIKWNFLEGPVRLEQYVWPHFIKNKQNIFLVLDSAKISNDKEYIDIIFDKIKQDAPDSKVLIIANKQDLSEAKSPQEIEEIFHYPTVGFSAIDSNAVKNFEKIVYDFFSNTSLCEINL